MSQEIDSRTRERLARRAGGGLEENSESEAERKKRERRERDFKAVAGTVEGRRILNWLVRKNRIIGFTGTSTDAYNLGLRRTGEDIETTLEQVLPEDLFIEILRMHKKEEV